MKKELSYLLFAALLLLSFVISIYANVWYLTPATAKSVSIAAGIPMVLIIISLLVFPSRVVVVMLGGMAFALPHYISEAEITGGVVAVYAALLLLLFIATTFVQRTGHRATSTRSDG